MEMHMTEYVVNMRFQESSIRIRHIQIADKHLKWVFLQK